MNRRPFPGILLTAVFLVACASPPTSAPAEMLPTDTPAPVSTATPEPTSTPVPTDTPTPAPTPTFEPRSRQEVSVDCKQDEQADEFLIEIAEETTVGDLAADPAIAACYGDTIHEKAANIATALDAQQELAQDTDGGSAHALIMAGTYELFLKTDAHDLATSRSGGFTVVPTPTPLPASAFSVEVVGNGEHGAMFELHYDGDWSDLDQMAIDLTAEQNGERIDVNQAFEVIDGRRLAEMTEATYHLGAVDVKLNIRPTDADSAQIEMVTEFTRWYPFIEPIFRVADLTNNLDWFPTHGHEEGSQNAWYAIDFHDGPLGSTCQSHEQHVGEGTPVYMDGPAIITKISSVEMDDENPGEYPNNYNVFYVHPLTGYIFMRGHQQLGPVLLDFLDSQGIRPDANGAFYYVNSSPQDGPVIPYDPDQPFTFFGPVDHECGSPHLHLEGQVPLPHHPHTSPTSGYHDGQLRYCNCAPDKGPCLPHCANMSTEEFLLADWIR